MGYIRPPDEISPGDRLCIMYGPGEEVDIDFWSTDGNRLCIMYGPGEEVDIDFWSTDLEPLDVLRCKAVLWVEVEKVVLISSKEEEE